MTTTRTAPQDDHPTTADQQPAPFLELSPSGEPIPVVSSLDLERDPHGLFRQWRSKSPVIQREDGACLVLRADDVERLLNDPRTQQIDGALYARMRGVPPGPLFDLLATSVLLSEGEAHRRRRAPLSRTFAFRAIESLRDTVRTAAEGLIDGFEADGAADLVQAFCAPLPPLVMSQLLGAPASDAQEFARAVYKVSPAFAPALPGEDMDRMVDGARWLTDYVKARLAEAASGQTSPAALLEDMLAAIGAGDLTEAEAAVQIVTLIIGASDTTRGALAVQVSLLAERGADWSDYGDNPELARAAVAEALRFEPPVGSFPRFSTEAITLDGMVIPAGYLVSLSTLSAMRDPARFQDPDAFLINRQDHVRWHMAFGAGAHRCIGEALARLELEEGLMALCRKLPHLRLAGPPVKVEGYAGIRRIGQLQVTW
jgi:cytochrome P450 family 103